MICFSLISVNGADSVYIFKGSWITKDFIQKDTTTVQKYQVALIAGIIGRTVRDIKVKI